MDGRIDGLKEPTSPRQLFHANCRKVSDKLAQSVPNAEKWLRWLDNFYAARLYRANAKSADATKFIQEIETSQIRTGLDAVFHKDPKPLSDGSAFRLEELQKNGAKSGQVMARVAHHWDAFVTKVNKLAQIDDQQTKDDLVEQLLNDIADLIVANNRQRGPQWSRPFDDILKDHPDMIKPTGHSGYYGMHNIKEGIQEPLELLLSNDNTRVMARHPLLDPKAKGSYTKEQLQKILAAIKAFPGKTASSPDEAWSSVDS
ncbi:hypothetical protein KA517_02650 [Candidatus Gracilibacteria bacterium]|nr:hypothetical protein [Candidatus Gracilibacteria bacterium]